MATTTAVRPVVPDLSTISGTRQWTVGKVVNRVLFWILVVFIIFYTIFPFVWALISSIKPNAELFTTPVDYWPSSIELDLLPVRPRQRRFPARAAELGHRLGHDGAHLSGSRIVLRLRHGSVAVPRADRRSSTSSSR